MHPNLHAHLLLALMVATYKLTHFVMCVQLQPWHEHMPGEPAAGLSAPTVRSTYAPGLRPSIMGLGGSGAGGLIAPPDALAAAAASLCSADRFSSWSAISRASTSASAVDQE